MDIGPPQCEIIPPPRHRHWSRCSTRKFSGTQANQCEEPDRLPSVVQHSNIVFLPFLGGWKIRRKREREREKDSARTRNPSPT